MLTTAEIDSFKPGAVRREIADGKQPGLYFVLQPTGARSWAYRYRSGGKTRKLTLGPYPAIGLKDARARAAAAFVQVNDCIDPAAEKAAKRAEKAAETAHAIDLVETVVARFLAQHVRRNLKPATILEVERIMNREVTAVWHGRRLSQIGRAHIHSVLDDICARGAPVTANRTLSWFRRMCSWAVERSLIDANPCSSVKRPAAETPRDRILGDDELGAVWRASGALETPYTEFLKLLILTGQRKSEVANMSWREIDFAAKLWTLPKERVKNACAHTVPLSDTAIETLRDLPRVAGSDLVFTLNGKRSITAFSLIKDRLDALMPPDTAPWVLHDLRRSFASGMARLGINLPVIERCLNHVSGSFAGIVGVYKKYSFEAEMRVAMQTWARFVDSLVKGEAGNVVSLRAGARDAAAL